MAQVETSDATVPNDIAATVVSSVSYTKEEVLYPAFNWLRDNVPVGKAQLPDYDPIWIITKHADVTSISRDNKTFVNGNHNLMLQTQENDQFVRKSNKGKVRSMNSLAFMDRPEHGVYRNITSGWFMPGQIKKLEQQIRQIAKDSVSDFLEFDGKCDLVRDFITFYPLRVIMNLLGVPREDEKLMHKLTQELFGGDEERPPSTYDGPDAAARAWRAALESFYDYFRILSLQRRANPTDDLISLIANTKIDGEFIDEDREFDYYVAIPTAGHDTTTSGSAGGLLGLMRFPDQYRLLQSDHTKIPGFVDEAIRYSVPIKHFMRAASCDTEVRGQKIKENDRLMLCYPSANRDREVFENADTFDITRSPNRHLSFGYGPHMCIGQNLAKFDMKILFEELLPCLDSIELDGDPRYVQSNFISGIKSLPVRFRAR